MKWKPRNLRELARMVVGDAEHFPYRSSKYVTEFFEGCELEFVHTGETRPVWAAARIEEVLAMPHPTPSVMPDAFLRIIRRLLDDPEGRHSAQRSRKADLPFGLLNCAKLVNPTIVSSPQWETSEAHRSPYSRWTINC